MSALVWLLFGIAMFFGGAWGAAENRCWKEAGDGWILSHFKLYHLLMALLFGWANALTVSVAFGANLSPRGFLLWLWLMVWDTLMLDVVWWVIRYLDVMHLGQTWRLLGRVVWRFPVKNEYDGGSGAAWHSRGDWDNYLGLPLVLRCYAWWWIFGVAGTCVLVLSFYV